MLRVLSELGVLSAVSAMKLEERVKMKREVLLMRSSTYLDIEYLERDKLTSLRKAFKVLCKLDLESAYPVVEFIQDMMVEKPFCDFCNKKIDPRYEHPNTCRCTHVTQGDIL